MVTIAIQHIGLHLIRKLVMEQTKKMKGMSNMASAYVMLMALFLLIKASSPPY